MYIFELRRILRQRQRNRVPIGDKKIDVYAVGLVLFDFTDFGILDVETTYHG